MTSAHRRPRRGRNGAARAATAGLAAGALVATGLVGATLAATSASAATADNPFGPNVTVFDPSMSTADINSALAAAQGYGEFSTDRHAFFFKPGTYGSAAGQDNPATATDVINGQVGYYETVAGLGSNPDDVTINGAVHAEGVPPTNVCPWDNSGGGDSALTNFWRSLSNMKINPIQQPVATDTGVKGVCYPTDDNPDGLLNPEGVADAHQLRWAVSQAAPLRRLDVTGSLSVFPRFGGFSSGGYLSDSRVAGTITSGSQQQWYTQDSQLQTWDGAVWNQVLAGVNADATYTTASGKVTADQLTYPTPAYTVVPRTPVSRDAPFLTWDKNHGYAVFVPDARTDSSGVSWADGDDAGASLPISSFFIAQPGDTAATINKALKKGKNLVLTPGVYSLDEALVVPKANQVVLGLGMATLSPTNGNAAIVTGDVKGIKIAGITVDAGAVKSDVLVQVGPQGAKHSDASNPTTLSDVFVRVGGPHEGKVTTAIEVNSPRTLLDDIWSWRADHGAGVGWDQNTADHGLVVNGAHVTATGLFVEHYQKEQVVWNGEDGTTVFYQSELPYDPPTQSAWMDGSRKGYASYAVSPDVTTHTAYGLGVYSFFDPTRNDGSDIRLESAITAPVTKGVTFTHAVSRFLNGVGGIDHVVNDAGKAAVAGTNDDSTTYLDTYPGPLPPTVKSISVQDGDVVSGKATFKVALEGPASDLSYTYIELNRGAGHTWVTDNTKAPGSTNSGTHPKLVVDTRTLPDGVYGLKVDAIGKNGKGVEKTVSFTIHNAPVLTFKSPATGDTVSGTTNVKVKLSGANQQAYNLRVDSAGLDYVYQPTAGTFAYKLDTRTLSNGTHTLLATATDKDGDKTTVTEKITVQN
ncbi:hypothetical protein GCM10023221_25690 [Luteimicrobium xylanilyticum]|uniref:Exo-beta-1,3-glucanase n=1 Tax=Luteimicrobium xylanilyticum TaxID=1133546 RepID=A0A5P9QE05_9MICO|nr:Ig-like domain-containing protein [Luteimicrobium xylanilyticum]QFU99694.1 Exo-beta-1,3-glucanase [Luteimicrobium xylanilyticum]